MHSLFKLIVDKVGSPYFTDSEIDEFLNAAQGSLLEDYVYNRNMKDKRMQLPLKEADPESGFENVAFLNEYISNLVTEISVVTDAQGQIPYAAIDASLPTSMYNLVNIARKDDNDVFRNVRYWRHNDYWRLKDNTLKTFDDENPAHLKYDDYIQVLPVAEGTDIDLTVIRYPRDIKLDEDTPANNQDSELSESSHDEIVYMALELAGISIREIQELYGPMAQKLEKEG